MLGQGFRAPDRRSGRRAIASLAGLVAAWCLVGCASEQLALPAQATSGGPIAPCVALTADNPGAGGVYTFPNTSKLANHTRCDIRGRALSVHQLGRLRKLYGPSKMTRAEAQSAIDVVIGQLKSDADSLKDGEPLKVLIFAHGGLVSHEGAVSAAEALAPGMMADGYSPVFLAWTSDARTTYVDRLCCVRDGEQNSFGGMFFAPVRLAGDFSDSGARALENFGKEWIRFRDSRISTAGKASAQAEADLVRQGQRPDDPARAPNFYFLTGANHETACKWLKDSDGACRRVVYPFPVSKPQGKDDLALLNDQRIPALSEQTFKYDLVWPARMATVATLPGPATQAWNNMIRRTRLAAEFAFGDQPVSDVANTEVNCADLTKRELGVRAPATQDGSSGAAGDGPPDVAIGGFAIFFDRLQCEIAQQAFTRTNSAGHPIPVQVDLYFYGHSMGAMIGDEAIWRYPDLPWKRIVYMSAASSIHDFRSSVAPILMCDNDRSPPSAACRRDVQFYNLMLHPLAESRELHLWGVAPEGSLLEWIDEMFGDPKAIDDRTLGKWTNVEQTLSLFPPLARQRMTFRVFPSQEVMKGDRGAADSALVRIENASFQAACVPGPGKRWPDKQDKLSHSPDLDPSVRCHPTMHGDFTNLSFWRDSFLRPPPETPQVTPKAGG